MSYKVVPIPAAITRSVRKTLVSPQYKSLAAAASVANGYGPCRSCLGVFDQGRDRRIFFTYDPFEGLSPLPDPGPIFIHEDECGRFEGVGFPPDLVDLPIHFEAFGEESRLIARKRMEPAEIDPQLNELLRDPQVRFVNLRNAEAGCFIARVDME